VELFTGQYQKDLYITNQLKLGMAAERGVLLPRLCGKEKHESELCRTRCPECRKSWVRVTAYWNVGGRGGVDREQSGDNVV